MMLKFSSFFDEILTKSVVISDRLDGHFPYTHPLHIHTGLGKQTFIKTLLISYLVLVLSFKEMFSLNFE